MTTDLEQQLRDRLDGATTHVVGGPDLLTSLRAGRSRRRRRATGLVGLAGAGAVAACVGLVALLGAGSAGSSGADSVPAASTGGSAPTTPAAAPADYVPGTDVDEQMAAAIATHLPALGEPQDVYPTDGRGDRSLPDDQADRAGAWRAVYRVSDVESLVVTMGYYSAALTPASQSSGPYSDPALEPGQHAFLSSVKADDGFGVAATEVVRGPSESAAADARTLDPASLQAVVDDPRLTFEEPTAPR